MRDSIGKVCGYSVKKGNSTYKSSELGHSRTDIIGLSFPPCVSPYYCMSLPEKVGFSDYVKNRGYSLLKIKRKYLHSVS